MHDRKDTPIHAAQDIGKGMLRKIIVAGSYGDLYLLKTNKLRY
jgi:hypothetical protein